MKKIKHIIIGFLLISISVSAQLQNSNWYFGNGSGLSFGNSSVSVLNGQTNTIDKHTATVSDASGNLLFYTDGNSVWNKNGVKMPNGNNTINSSNRTVVVSPFPNNSNKYYIFTSKNTYVNNNIQSTKYYYSIVNLANGLGTVETLNVDLSILPYLPVGGDFRGKAIRDHMSLTKHSDGESYWLIINPFDYFFALKISSNGISSPVVSYSDGGYYPSSSSNLVSESKGSSGMSISADSNMISYFNNSNIPGSGSGGTVLYTYTFNNQSGVIYNRKYYLTGSTLNPFIKGYSVEFSSNNRYLFALGYSTNSTIDIIKIDLDNLTSNPQSISSINNYSSNYNYHTMRLAMDGKIYVPHFTYDKLSVINSPNNFSVNFIYNQVDLQQGSTVLLPQQIPFQGPVCQNQLVITQDIYSGQTDNQQAQNTISAANIINNGATANYDAGYSVVLKPGFRAVNGANFRAFIQGCNSVLYKGNSNNKKGISVKEPDFMYLSSNGFIVTYPNPIVNQLFINSKKEIINWSLTSVYGKEFYKGTGNVKKINTQKLPKGIYLLKISLKNGEIITKKILKRE